MFPRQFAARVPHCRNHFISCHPPHGCRSSIPGTLSSCSLECHQLTARPQSEPSLGLLVVRYDIFQHIYIPVLTTRGSAAKVNFAVAGGFMVGMFLSAADDSEVEYWQREITTYRDLLKAHSPNFNVTKLAVIRMDLLLQQDSPDMPTSEEAAALNTRRALPMQELEDKTQDVLNDAGTGGHDNDFSTEPLRNDFPIDPAIAFGNTYGLEWDTDIDQLLSNFDYNFD